MKLDLEIPEINLVLQCLAKQPFEIVANLIVNIQNQVKEQQKPQEH